MDSGSSEVRTSGFRVPPQAVEVERVSDDPPVAPTVGFADAGSHAVAITGTCVPTRAQRISWLRNSP